MFPINSIKIQFRLLNFYLFRRLFFPYSSGNISNLDTFFKVINQCDGAVELSLPEGGSVNLKSKLSQYFSMATVFSNGNIKELSLTTHNDEDSKRLIQYMVQGC